MTTNKPEVFRSHCYGQRAPAYHCNKPADNSGEYVRLAEYEALQAECEKLRKDAERYRWLRMADWRDSPLCAVRNPAKQVKLGSDCPSRDRLDDAIDVAMQGDNPCQA